MKLIPLVLTGLLAGCAALDRPKKIVITNSFGQAELLEVQP